MVHVKLHLVHINVKLKSALLKVYDCVNLVLFSFLRYFSDNIFSLVDDSGLHVDILKTVVCYGSIAVLVVILTVVMVMVYIKRRKVQGPGGIPKHKSPGITYTNTSSNTKKHTHNPNIDWSMIHIPILRAILIPNNNLEDFKIHF